jgi:hypothetical protein
MSPRKKITDSVFFRIVSVKESNGMKISITLMPNL